MRQTPGKVESSAMIRMTVKDGSIVQTLTLDGDKVFLGRLDSNTVMLTDPSVSRKHCLIRRTGRHALEVLDLNSRHGTRRNGSSIDRSPLVVGDELNLGEVEIRIEALEGLPASALAANRPPRAREGGEKKPEPEGKPAREKKELLSDIHRTSFSEEVYSALRRTPWWAASLALHMLLVYVFFSVPFGPVIDGSPFGSVNGTIDDDFSSMLQDDFDLAPEPEPPAEPDEEELTFPEELDTMPTEVPEPEPEEDFTLPEIGPGTIDLSGALARTVPNAPVIPDSGFGKSGADSANRAAMALLKQAMGGRGTNSLAAILRRFKKGEILVARGHYDHVQEILDLLGLARRYDIVPMVRLDRADLSKRRVLFINCSNETLGKKTHQKIREFVKRGGYLLTTDWAIEKVIEPCFEGYIRVLRRNGRNVITPDEVIGIHTEAVKRKHFLLRGTAITGKDAKWWLEESSFPFEVLKKSEVEVLITSEDLKKKYGTEEVAITFRYGKGRVFHMLGHFYQKEGNLKGTFSTQRMIANFLIGVLRKQ
jgi:pSer/pThr/pTyr-binding forkhead associated (FHA) protein